MIKLPVKENDSEGFTLMEMLVVLVVIALIAAVAIPQVMRMLESAKSKAARIQLETVSQALSVYKLDNDAYPTAQQGLRALIEAPQGADNWTGPYLRREQQLRDPWGHPLQYTIPTFGDGFVVKSLGANGVAGGNGEDKDVEIGE
jgi:general secretion pathway protein G